MGVNDTGVEEGEMVSGEGIEVREMIPGKVEEVVHQEGKINYTWAGKGGDTWGILYLGR